MSKKLLTKKGLLRANLLGKRTRNCARSVITGDPTLKPN